MPSITLTISYNTDLSQVIDVATLRRRYLFGAQQLTVNGQYIGDDVLSDYIDQAMSQIENDLSIKIPRQVVSSKADWYRPDWNNWGSIRLPYPIHYAVSMYGLIGTIRQIQYPREWVSIDKGSDDLASRMMHIVPNGSTAPFTQNAITYSGITPHLGLSGQAYIPNYWEVTYITGWDKIPDDILAAIGMLAAIPILLILSDNVLGPGINSKSISIDGLSQSLATSGGYKQRIDNYQQQLVGTKGDGMIAKLRSKYKGITMTVC